MTHPRILIILGLLLVGGVASCTRPAATAETTPSTSMSASDSPSATPSASDSSATPAMSATPTDAPATAAAPVTAAAPPAAGTAKAPTTKAATKATTTTKATRTTAAPPPPPPPPATTVKPAGPGTVTLKCYPLGDGRTRVSLTWQNTGFGASVTANGKKYSTSDTTVTGYGAGIPETTPGHGSCSGTVGGITKTGSY